MMRLAGKSKRGLTNDESLEGMNEISRTSVPKIVEIATQGKTSND